MDDPWVAWSDTVNKRLAALEKTSLKYTPDQLWNGIADFVVQYVNETLEKRRVVRDTGTWKPEQLYAPGAAVTDKGAMWLPRPRTGQRVQATTPVGGSRSSPTPRN
jgi:hypothetical protein